MAPRKDMRDRAKSLWIKGMKAIGNTAASIANNTRYKVDEVTIQNRRREVMNDLAVKAYALWLKGEPFPEQMEKMLDELKTLDEQLNDMRAEKYASSNRTPQTEADATAADAEEEEPEEPEDPGVLPAEDSPVTTEINELFDTASPVGVSAERVNAALDQMSERIRRFPVNGDSGNTDKRQD